MSLGYESWRHTSQSNFGLYQFDYVDDTVILHPRQPVQRSDIGAIKKLASPHLCRGHRVRFQSDVSTQDTDGAGLWLMANHERWHITDGMYDRLIKGSSNWTHLELVIDVPIDAAYVSYGLWMTGSGVCRMRNPQFDIADELIYVSTTKIWDRVSPQRWQERTQ